MCAFLQNARHLSAGQGNLFTALCQRGRSIIERTLICAHAYLRACFFECTLLNYLSISGLENVVANSKLLFYLSNYDGFWWKFGLMRSPDFAQNYERLVRALEKLNGWYISLANFRYFTTINDVHFSLFWGHTYQIKYYITLFTQFRQ